MTTLNTSFCENMCYAVLKVKKIKELCNHNSWKEGKKRGGGGGQKQKLDWSYSALGALPV